MVERTLVSEEAKVGAAETKAESETESETTEVGTVGTAAALVELVK